jgi:predicted transposase/invertase (TIGR01784 family)
MTSERKPVNRLNDALMKYVFADNERKHITLSLINSVFELEGTPLLVDFSFRDREISPDNAEGKESQLDILGSSSDGTVVNVEVQINPLKSMGKRSLFYWSRLYNQLRKGKPYGKLPRTACINLLAFNLFTDNEFASDWHSCFAVVNKKRPEHLLTEDLEIHFLELPKWERLRRTTSNYTAIDKWLAYFSRSTTPEQMEELAMSETIIQDALQAEQRFMQDPNLVTAYDQAEKARLDRIAREEYLLDQGRTEGLVEGRKAGIDEGRKEERREIAFTLLGMNKPFDEISAITGLSEAEILSLKNAQ